MPLPRGRCVFPFPRLPLLLCLCRFSGCVLSGSSANPSVCAWTDRREEGVPRGVRHLSKGPFAGREGRGLCCPELRTAASPASAPDR